MKVTLTSKFETHKIEWIKKFREATRWGLKESKDLADTLEFQNFSSHTGDLPKKKQVELDISLSQFNSLRDYNLVLTDTNREVKNKIVEALEIAIDEEDFGMAKSIAGFLEETYN